MLKRLIRRILRLRPADTPARVSAEALEPRVLYSADPFGGETWNGAAEVRLLQPIASALTAPVPAQTTEANQALEAEESSATQIAPDGVVVFVDASVQDIHTHADAWPEDAQVIALQPGIDGVDQMRDALSGQRELRAIHLVTQGRSGHLQLGSTVLDEQLMTERYADALAHVGQSLAHDGDIFVYGCDFASGSQGRSAAQALAELTGAQVSASSATQTRGPWILDTSTGPLAQDSQHCDAQADTATDTQSALAREIVFVDSAVADADTLLNQLLLSRGNANVVTVMYIGAHEDGLAAISRTLSAEQGVTAVHIISHGDPGRLLLGAGMVDAASLNARATELGGWATALSNNADIVLYGCDVAATPDGLEFVDLLARLTGADVAASVDATGSAAAGGDWTFERQAGHIETAMLDAVALQDWRHTLALGVDATTSGVTATNSITLSHTTSGINRLMLVGVSMHSNNVSVSSMTYNGQPLTLLGTQQNAGDQARIEIWAMVAPPTGTYDLITSFGGSRAAIVGVMTLTGVDQSLPHGVFYGATGNSPTAELNGVVSASGELVFGVVDHHKGQSLIPGVGQTEYWDLFGNNANGGGTLKAGAATVDLSWALDQSEKWAVGAVSIRPIDVSPVNTVPGPQNTNEDTARVFSAANGNSISIDDPDAGGADNQVTLSVTSGSLTLAGSAGLSFVTGDGTADPVMTFRGTAAAINAALDGLGFAPASNANGGATLTLVTKDSLLLSLDIDANLQGRYEFSGNGNDSGGAAQNASLNNGAAVVTDATRGEVLSLDGVDDHATIAGTFGNPSEVTIGGWVKLSSGASARREFISLDDRVHISLNESGNGVKGSVQVGASAWTDLPSGAFFAAGDWHHVMYTYSDSANAHKLYIDGALVAEAAIASSVYWTGATTSFIGRHPVSGNHLPGQVDDIRVYDRVLSASEIASLADDLNLVDTDTVAITVNAVNDAPSGVNASLFAAINEDEFNSSGKLVSDFTAGTTDPDAGALKGIYVSATHTTNGQWQYTLDGSNWFDIGAVSSTNALLLPSDATSRVRFVPDADWNGTVFPFTLGPWDQTSGSPGAYADASVTGGSTAFGAASASVSITVQPVNDAPVLATGSTLAYTENQAATAINTAITVSDVDNATLATATVQITANYQSAEDVLAFTNVAMGNIAGVWNAGTGTMTLTSAGATATLAQWQAALRAVTYANSSDNPSAAARTVSFAVNDGALGSNTVISTINITAINDVPTLANLSGDALAYAEGDGTVLIEQGSDATVADVDSTDLNGGALTVSFVSGSDSAEDVLAVRNQGTGAGQIGVSGANVSFGGVTIGTWAGGSGGANLVISFNASATPAAAQALVRNITYQNIDTDAPTTGARSVRLVLTDGDGGTSANHDASVTVSAVNDAPVNTVPGSISVTEDVTTALTGISIADGDASGAPMLVTLSVPTGSIAATTGGGVTVGGSAAARTLTGTVSDINAFLAAGNVTYTTAADANGSVTLTVLTSDQGNTGSGGTLTDSDTVTLNITAVNDAPVLANGSTLAYTENQAATAINTAITVSDVDNATLATATVQITANYLGAEDVLAFTNVGMGNIAGVWNSGTGTMTLTSAGATATVAEWQAALRAVTYANSSNNPSIAARTVSYAVHDGAQGSNTVTSTVNVAAVNDAPTLASLASDALAYAEGDGSVVIEQGSDATVADVDSADFSGGALSVAFVSGSDSAQDVLAVRNQGTGAGQIGVSGSDVSYGGVAIGTWAGGSSGANLVISFNASATPAAAQALVRNITYQNTDSNAPTAGARTVRFVLTDGDGGTSADHDATITVSGVNNAPVLHAAAFVFNPITEDALNNGGQTVASLLSSAGSLAVSDADPAAQQGIAVIAADAGNGNWQFSTDGGTLWQAVGVVSDSAALLLRSSDLIRFVPNGQQPTSARLGLRAWDQTSGTAGGPVNVGVAGGSSAFSAATAQASIAVGAVNDAPISAAVDLTPVAEDGGARIISQAELLALAQDVDGDALQALNLRISGGAGSLADNGNGSWTYRAPLNFNGPVLFSYEVSDGAHLVAGSARLDITPVNDRPVTAPLTLAGITEDSGPRVITQGELLAQASDVDADALVASDLRISGGAGTLVDNGNGTWTYTPALNDNGAVSFSYRIDDGQLGTDASATLIITALNDAPQLQAAGQTGSVSLNRDENSTQVVSVTASDVDHTAQTLRFSLVGGADAALFALDSNTGELRFNQAPDFEQPGDANTDGVYEVTVRVDDPAGGQDELALRVRIGDINDPPVLSMPDGIQLNAQPQPDQVVASIGGSDQDAGDELQFALLDDALGRFVIDAKTGDIRFTGAAPAAQGGASVHTLVVQVTDQQGGRQARTLALVVPGRVSLGEIQSLLPGARSSQPSEDIEPQAQNERATDPQDQPAPVWIAAELASDEDAQRARERLAALLRELQNADADVVVLHKNAAARSNDNSMVAAATAAVAPAGTSVLDAVAALISADGDGQALRVADLLGRQWGSGRRGGDDGDADEQDALASGTRKGATEPVDQLLLQFTKAEHVAGVGLSVGLVWWLTRGGGLLASAMMGAPAWKQVDLLTIMAAPDEDDLDDESDEVKELFGTTSTTSKRPAAKPA